MSTFEYCRQLLHPISSTNPCGLRVTNDPRLDLIEAELMKIGSLSHSEIKWDKIEQNVIELLTKSTKDVKLLAILMQSLQQSQDVDRFMFSLEILVDFMTNYWQESHIFDLEPKDLATHILVKNKIFNQICHRTLTMIAKIIVSEISASCAQLNEHIFTQFVEQAKLLNLSIDMVTNITAYKDKFTTVNQNCVSAGELQPELAQEQSTNVSVASAKEHKNILLDTSNKVHSRKLLLQIADTLVKLGNDGTKLSIQVRRMAIWRNIDSLPDADSAGITKLVAPAFDRCRNYQEQFKQNCSLELWEQIERSIVASPFWFDGHYLSYQVALKLGQEEWAQVILDEVQNFTAKIVGITQLFFSDHTKFASDATLNWLEKTVSCNLNSSNNSHTIYVSEKQIQVMQVAKENVLLALSQANEQLARTTQLRDSVYWQLLITDLLQEQQFTEIAKLQYQKLAKEIQNISLAQWEPELFLRLKLQCK